MESLKKLEEIIGVRVATVLNADGSSAPKLGMKLGLPSQTITHIRSGIQIKPRLLLVMAIINKMGIDPKWLAGDIGTDNEIIYQKQFKIELFESMKVAEPNVEWQKKEE